MWMEDKMNKNKNIIFTGWNYLFVQFNQKGYPSFINSSHIHRINLRNCWVSFHSHDCDHEAAKLFFFLVKVWFCYKNSFIWVIWIFWITIYFSFLFFFPRFFWKWLELFSVIINLWFPCIIHIKTLFK